MSGANAAEDCVHLRVGRALDSRAGETGRNQQVRLGPTYRANQNGFDHAGRGSRRVDGGALVAVAAGNARRALPAIALFESTAEWSADLQLTENE